MIKIICVGKIKESFYREAIDEYLKRMGKYHKVEIIEVMDSNIKTEKCMRENNIRSEYSIHLGAFGRNLLLFKEK